MRRKFSQPMNAFLCFATSTKFARHFLATSSRRSMPRETANRAKLRAKEWPHMNGMERKSRKVALPKIFGVLYRTRHKISEICIMKTQTDIFLLMFYQIKVENRIFFSSQQLKNKNNLPELPIITLLIISNCWPLLWSTELSVDIGFR